MSETEEKTRSLLADMASMGSHQRIVANWKGGTASMALPDTGRLTVGRSSECDLMVGGSAVSRVHLALHLDKGRVFVEDLGSSNGTRLQEQLLAPGQWEPLAESAWVQFGTAALVLLSVEAGGESAAEEATAAAAQETEMASVLRLARLVARGTLGIVLQGETGVGKEVLAQLIHRESPRADEPFIRLNCAALPESMAESELFGHERGAFTGASMAHRGHLEAAHGGTIFLDEVGELSAALQAKLLRALGSHEIVRVGSTTPRPIDVRVLSASHKNLQELVRGGGFREDLYYRLAGMTLEVPPLRRRREELPDLTQELLVEECQKLGLPPPALDAQAQEQLARYSFPGNIRELRSCLQRAVLLSQGNTIGLAHLGIAEPDVEPAPASAEARTEPRPSVLPDELRELERRRIAEVLDACSGNQTRSAETLGISRRALIRRLDEFGFPRPRKS